ncbi:uncharacterized protein LOC132640570 [Lycium barbarum]|uniref:uncharacterized protein LOC132640570 n=1 Tax=Lycium barbarum TaxID=112863 RepID=UPI00293EA164|nr:uncharacterized protein LOC132640570 [Lycium barbarum]XP_060213182.1 uncharacterized protein LOC132640570 [Lycium barbarum]
MCYSQFMLIRGKSKLRHWVLGVFTFSDWCIHVYDSQCDSKNDKLVMKTLVPYKTLLPYFLEKSKFNVKRGIDKTQSDALLINLVNNLPQQIKSDCGVFVAVFVNYFVHRKEIKKDNIDIEIHHTRYGSLLWDYGRKEQKAVGLKKLLADGLGGRRGNVRKSRGCI